MLRSFERLLVDQQWLRAVAQVKRSFQDVGGSASRGNDARKETCTAEQAADSRGCDFPQTTNAHGHDPDSASDATLSRRSAPGETSDSLQQKKKQPSADWYTHGLWIDPAIIERRMRDDEPADTPLPSTSEPETAVGRTLSALIKVIHPNNRCSEPC
jgi:hypothetical protein